LDKLPHDLAERKDRLIVHYPNTHEIHGISVANGQRAKAIGK
jgi:hypothetical protein